MRGGEASACWTLQTESSDHSMRAGSISRRIAKMMAKQNWFKRKPEDQAESPSKKMKLVQKDGNSSRRMENLPEGWRTFQRDGNGSMVVEVHA